MASWVDRVRAEVDALVALNRSDEFTRQQFLEFALPRLAAESTGATPEQTVSRVLQEMREAGELEFVQRGRYRSLRQEPAQPLAADVNRGPHVATLDERIGRILSRPFQKFLRSKVIPNFGHACAVCELQPEWFVDVAHLRPVASHLELAADPACAVALCKNHHAAHDAGALRIEADLTIRIDRDRLEPSSRETERQILSFDGRALRAPKLFGLSPLALPSGPE